MPVTKDMLVTELQNLLRLTAFEQTIATVRRTQARTTALETELAENVKKARERTVIIGSAIKQLGGTPDVVGSAVSKVGAFATTQLNQVQTLQGALLGDLTLEHQLRERARYARGLAVSLGETSLLPVFDRLETAQTATIEWLEERLAEVGRTGTSLLRATPVQAVVGNVRKVVAVPFGAAASAVNAASALLWKKTPVQVQDALTSAVSTADEALDKGVAAARKATQRTSDVATAAATGVEGVVAEAVDTVEEKASDVARTVTQVASDTAATVAETASDVVDKTEDVVADASSRPRTPPSRTSPRRPRRPRPSCPTTSSTSPAPATSRTRSPATRSSPATGS